MSSPAERGRPGPRAVVPQSQVRGALRSGELLLHYQRIVSLETAVTTGVEALLRWQHPHEGLLLPDDFLPAVAHTPVIHEITGWVLRTALGAVRQWPDWSVSVNISALDATRPQLVHDVEAALLDADVDPARLTLELTEQAMVQDLDGAVGVLGSLRQLGVGLSLDDFGTGYSSLLYLRDLPLTELKVDRTFFAGVPRSDEDVAIVRSCAQLGRSIGLRVVAEGIETAAQARVAMASGCHAAQGRLWGLATPEGQLDPDRLLRLPGGRGVAPARPVPPTTRTERRIQELHAEGASLHTIAAALNREGLRTDKQVRWTARTVALLVSRLPPADQEA